MRLLKPFMCVLFGFFAISLCGQQTIDKVEVDGLKRTKTSHIERFLKVSPGSISSEEAIQADIQQLRNLQMVTDVSAEVVQRNDSAILIYTIEEALTFFPIVNFGGIEENIWFQLGAKEQNIGGRGIQGIAYYLNNNGLHNGQLYTRIPYIRGTKWGITANLQQWSSPEPLFFGDRRVDYTYTNSIAGLGVLREFGFQHTLELGFSYFIENYERQEEFSELDSFNPPANARIPKTIGKLNHHFGKMNYHFFYLSGWDIQQYAQVIDDLDLQGEELFKIYWANARYLKVVGKEKKGNLAARGRLGISSNGDTPFAPFVIDSQMNIRGVGNRIDRGTATVVLNIEYRYTLKEKANVALQGVLFSDAGTWRNPAGDWDDLFDQENFEHFAGIGLRGIYKKAHNAILRIDYGFNLYNTKTNGLVIGVGQYF